MFIIKPDAFTWGFELNGETGQAIIQGLGVLFLMWNVPYVFAVWNPIKFRISLYEAILMQTIGVFGESFHGLRVGTKHALLGCGRRMHP